MKDSLPPAEPPPLLATVLSTLAAGWLAPVVAGGILAVSGEDEAAALAALHPLTTVMLGAVLGGFVLRAALSFTAGSRLPYLGAVLALFAGGLVALSLDLAFAESPFAFPVGIAVTCWLVRRLNAEPHVEAPSGSLLRVSKIRP